MRTFSQIAPLRVSLRGLRAEGKTIGFVPTMGALHEGHLTLMRKAKSECDVAVASVFVNPTQFGQGEDFEAYPRDLNKDLQMAANAGVDIAFTPDTSEMYPLGYQTAVTLSELTVRWEGEVRPGHFQGVATVVAKLLNIVQPERAYFGQKDYQQLLVIERLVRDLNIPTTVVMVPTVREPDGLAMSSRNAYLDAEQRQASVVLSRLLRRADELVKSGQTDSHAVRTELEALLRQTPDARADYIALAHPETLEPVVSLAEPTVVLLAIRIGKTRLIDNALIAPDGVPIPRLRG
jgi:pantoate--beta-alanine ligase